jgi:hypothetical protein
MAEKPQDKESWADVGKGMLIIGGTFFAVTGALWLAGEKPSKELLAARARNRASRPPTLSELLFPE